MHRDFLRLLENAEGRSKYIIVVNLDIRGFTPFCQRVESVQVGTYITRVYLKIINDYFQNTSFYKPTGDGLIITIPYNAKSLKEVANSTVDSCLKLLNAFPSLLEGDAMINYTTPQKIGIGLTRGSASCITSKDNSEEKILDYSGRILNLASRLMDMARPSGIVLDDSFGINLLKDETKELFSEEEVYVRGVSEEKPVKIHHTKEYTLIPESYKKPFKEPQWELETHEYLLGTIKKTPRWFWWDLTKTPLDKNKITIKVVFPNPEVSEFDAFYTYFVDYHKEASHKREGKKHRVGIDLGAIGGLLTERGVPDDTTIKFEIIYPTR